MRFSGSSMPILRRSTRTLILSQIVSASCVCVTDPNSTPFSPALTSKRISAWPRRCAISCACSKLCASFSARRALTFSSSATREGVAGSASRRGSRKFRAYPRATSTTSPRRPSFSTSSRSTTFISVGNVRQQRHLSRALDRHGDLPLVAPARPADPARADLALLGHVPAEPVEGLPVHLGGLLLAAVTGTARARPLRRLARAAPLPVLLLSVASRR